MRVVPFAKVLPSDWNALCDASPQAWLFHRTEWVHIETHRFFPENLSFAVEGQQGLAAVLPLYATHYHVGTWIERLIHSGFHRHTGLALAPELSSADAKAARSAAMRHLFGLAEREKADRIQLNTHNLAPENLSVERQEIPFWVENYAFSLGMGFGPNGLVAAPGVVTCCADQIIDLRFDESDLFRRLDDPENVRKAQRENVTFTLGNAADAVTEFFRIAQKSAARTGEELLPLDYYEEIWRTFHGSSKSAILFARHNDSAVSAILLLVYKKTATYFASFSDPASLHLRANDFLLWSAMIWAKRSGLTHFRLGPFFPDAPKDWPIVRVSKFKTKFGARSFTTIQGSLFCHPDKYLAAAQMHLLKLCSRDESRKSPADNKSGRS